MLELAKIDLHDLKEAIKALNDSGLLDPKIKTIGVKKEELVKLFTVAVEKLDEDGKGTDVPEVAVNLFNTIYADQAETPAEPEPTAEPTPEPEPEEKEEDLGEEKPEEPKPAKEPKAKKEAKVKEPKPAKEPKPPKEPKAPKELSRYGHKVGTQAAKLDDMFFEGTALAAAATALDTPVSRVRNHLQHLRAVKGLKIELKDGIYKVV